MTRELDTREIGVSHIQPAQTTEAHRLAGQISENLPGDYRVEITSFDPMTGNPAAVRSVGGPTGTGRYVQRALEHVSTISPVLGLNAQRPEVSPDPSVQTTSSGAAAVNLQQYYLGIPVFGAALTVRFDPAGAIRETVGTVQSIPDDIVVLPTATAASAVAAAAAHVADRSHGPEESRDDAHRRVMRLLGA